MAALRPAAVRLRRAGAGRPRTTLTLDHPQIKFRKQHLARYLAALVTKPYDGKMVEYLDMVGKMHTPKAGSKDLDVPLVQMNALMGFVADALTATILGLKPRPRDRGEDAPGVRQAAVAAERPDRAPLRGDGGRRAGLRRPRQRGGEGGRAA